MDRLISLCGAALIAACMSLPASGQPAWPARPVRVINPFAAGGPLDVLGRILSERLAQRLGQPFVTEYRVGASGNIGVDAVAKAAPDGYTVGWVVDFVLTFNPSLYPRMPFDVEKDLQPVALFALSDVALVVHPSVSSRSMTELVALSKKQSLAFASAGIGSPGHVFGELFKREFGLEQMVHVPYKGNAPASQSILAGETQLFFGALPGTLANVRAGKLRAIATFSRERLGFLADVPTAREQGYPKFEIRNWYGMVAPAGVPRDIIDRLNREILAVTREQDFAERLDKQGYAPFAGTPEEMRALIRSDSARWGALIKAAGIKAE